MPTVRWSRRGDRARLRHRDAGDGGGAAPAPTARRCKRATTRRPARTRATPRGCWRWPPSCSRTPALAGARARADRRRRRARRVHRPARRRRHRARARAVARRSSWSASRASQALAPAARRRERPRRARRDRRAPRRGRSPRRSPRPSGAGARAARACWRPATDRRALRSGAGRAAGALARGRRRRACAIARSSRPPASRCRPTTRRCTCSRAARSASSALRGEPCGRLPAGRCPTTCAGPTPSSTLASDRGRADAADELDRPAPTAASSRRRSRSGRSSTPTCRR